MATYVFKSKQSSFFVNPNSAYSYKTNEVVSHA